MGVAEHLSHMHKKHKLRTSICGSNKFLCLAGSNLGHVTQWEIEIATYNTRLLVLTRGLNYIHTVFQKICQKLCINLLAGKKALPCWRLEMALPCTYSMISTLSVDSHHIVILLYYINAMTLIISVIGL